MMTKRILTLAIPAVLVLLVAATARADSFRVTLDTSPLSGPQTLAFGLTNSTAHPTRSARGFQFRRGSAIAGSEDCTFGGTFSGLGCSGDLTSGVERFQDFESYRGVLHAAVQPGSTSLSFVLTATNNFGGGVPDQFAMAVCDAGLTTCYSDDASGAVLLLDPRAAAWLCRAS